MIFLLLHCLYSRTKVKQDTQQEEVVVKEQHFVQRIRPINYNGFSVLVLNCKFYDCYIEGHSAGAIFCQNCQYCNISGCEFSNCTSDIYGGAIDFGGKKLNISKCSASACYATEKGQFIFIHPREAEYPKAIYSENNIVDCAPDRDIGFLYGIDSTGGTTNLSNSNFTGNNVFGIGAACAIKATLKYRSKFCNYNKNSGKNIIYITNHGRYARAEVLNSNFFNNTVSPQSVILFYGTVKVENCLFEGNSKYIAAADWDQNGQIVFLKCQFDVEMRKDTFITIKSCEVITPVVHVFEKNPENYNDV